MISESESAEDDDLEYQDRSSLFVRRPIVEPTSKLGDWNPTFNSDTSTLVNWWGGFAILALIGTVIFLVWPAWGFRNPRLGHLIAGYGAVLTIVFALMAYGFWRRYAWAGVAGVLIPSLSAVSRLALVILQFMANKPIKWNVGLQIALSVWLAWRAWKWLKERRQIVEIDANDADPSGTDPNDTEPNYGDKR